MRHLNWKADSDTSMVAWASRVVGGKYRVIARENADGVWFEVEHLVHNGWRSFRYADWEKTPVQHQSVIRTYAEAFAVAEADNDQRRASKARSAARRSPLPALRRGQHRLLPRRQI
jgi:hypothetical protein